MGMDTTDTQCVEKSIRCSKRQWVLIFAAMRHMKPDSEFSREVATQVNQVLGVTILRGDGGEVPPDTLKSDPEAVNRAPIETDDSDITFVIASWVLVQLELVGIRMETTGSGVNVGFGTYIGDMLKIQVVYIQKPHQVGTQTPQEGQLLEDGDVSWCQLKFRRFWNLHLVISEEVAKSGALVDGNIWVDPTLKGNSQYLLLPAVRRRCSGGVVTPAVQGTSTLDQLNIASDIIEEQIATFFHGLGKPGDMLVELRSHAVHIRDPPKDFHTRGKEVVPLAFCAREEAFARLQSGWPVSPYDLHGALPHHDVKHCLELGHRTQSDQIGLSLVGLTHRSEPHVLWLPKRAHFDNGLWWESPPSLATVLQADSAWLMLPHQDPEHHPTHFESAPAEEGSESSLNVGKKERLGPALFGAPSMRKSPSVGDERLSEPRHQLPIDTEPRYVTETTIGRELQSTSDGDHHWQGAASLHPFPMEAGGVFSWIASDGWQQGFTSPWWTCSSWSPDAPGDDGLTATAASQFPGSGNFKDQWQPPGDNSWSLPAPAASQHEKWQRKVRGNHQKHKDPLSLTDIERVLKRVATFKLVDHSRSGKLGLKGRGVWDVETHASDDSPGMQELQQVYETFWAPGLPYETPMLLHYATNAGKHEILQKLFALGNPMQKKQLITKLGDGPLSVSYLMTDMFGALFLQQVLHESFKMTTACLAPTRAFASMGFDTQRASLDPWARELMDTVVAVVAVMKDTLLDPSVIERSSICPNGNHVMQKWVHLLCILPWEGDTLRQTVVALGNSLVEIGTTQAGCRVIQKLLGTADRHLLHLVYSPGTFGKLATSEYGNYVSQHILDPESGVEGDDKLPLLQRVVENFTSYSLGLLPRNEDLKIWKEEHKGFYLAHEYGRHVVLTCLTAPHNTCKGWNQLREQVVNMVLNKGGTTNVQFQHCVPHAEMIKFLQALHTKSQARSSARAGGGQKPRKNT